MALSGLGMRAGNFLASYQFRADIRKVIGPSKKYCQKPVPKTLTYTGNKPIHMTDTIEEYFQMIKKGSNKFREIIAQSRNVRINESGRLQNKLGVYPISQKVVMQTMKNMHSKIIPNDAKDYKFRALMGKTQFNNQLKHWTDVDEACHLCGEPEDFKHGVFHCGKSGNIFKYIFDRLKLGATVNIKNMILSHERQPSDNSEQTIKYELIDTVSTIALNGS